jgi:hypothetical protein
MFVPSQQQFPIAPVPVEIDHLKWCSICNNGSPWNQIFAPMNVASGSYAIINGKVNTVCKSCRRYVGLDHSSELFLKGWLPGLSKAEWQDYKQFLRQRVPLHIARHLYEAARQERYFQATTHHWEDFFSPMEIRWLKKQFRDLTWDLDFVDNYRVADKAKRNQVRRYKKWQARGCCGSVDVERFCWFNLRTYLLGCNYGH